MPFLNKKYKVGLNVVLVSVIAFCLLLMSNYLANRHYKRFDLTRNKLYTLSDKTISILKDLNKEVKVTVFYQPIHLVYKDIKTLLSEYEAVSKKIKIEYVDPDKDLSRVKLLAKKYKVEALNTIVFEADNQTKHISENDIIEYDYQRNMYGGTSTQIKAFKGEEGITSAILSVTEEDQKTVYFVSGHGEKEIADEQGSGLFQADTLLKKDNYQTKKIVLIGAEQIPEECDILAIIGPEKSFTDHEVAILDKYLEKGGKLLAAIDPLQETELEGLLFKWGVKLDNTIVVDPEKQLPFVNAANLYVDSYSQHPIGKNMQSFATIYFLARSVDKAEDIENKNLQITKIAETTESGWGEVDLDNMKFSFDETKDKKGPVAIAIAVSSPKVEEARLVVFGDADFVSDSQIANMGNADMFLNTINWLAVNEKLISLSSKPKENTSLILSAEQINGIFWRALIVLPFFGILFGTFMWFKRRK